LPEAANVMVAPEQSGFFGLWHVGESVKMKVTQASNGIDYKVGNA
jgi:hypothetical protein